MPSITSAAEARQFLLGVDFQPKKQNIDTPECMLAKGFPEESLCLVGFAADTASALNALSNGDNALYVALCTCACLRWRADETAIFEMADARELLSGRDVDLTNELAKRVRLFLGLSAKAVPDTKNASPVASTEDGQKNDGGTALPSSTSDSPPSEPASEPSNTATSSSAEPTSN